MNISSPFIQRPVMTTFVMLSIILAGVFAYFSLPVSDLPTIERQHMTISTGYTGASPETVLNQVTTPLEKELTHIQGIEEITSTSSSGSSSISLTFAFSKDMNQAVREVQAAINTVKNSLPLEVDSGPTYALDEQSHEPIMYMLLISDELGVGDLRSYADTYVIPRVTRVDGVSKVEAFGPPKSLWIKLNPETMAARNVGFNQVVNTIRQQTKEIPLGSIQTGSKRLSIEIPQTISRGKDLENATIIGTSVKLKEIAEISGESGQEMDFRFVTDGKSSKAVVLGVQKVGGGNTVAISKAVRKVLQSIEDDLPQSIRFKLWYDKAVWIKESVVDVQWTLAFAFILVVLVIYFSLGRLAESMISSAALPISLIGTCAIMYVCGFSLNLLTLLALTLSVGFVVDDAIVVLENIVRWQEKGSSPKQASFMGSQQICFTILSMTLSLVAVFIPLLFMSGLNGRLFREFSITLSVAILVSGFVSLTLTPMLCSRFLSKHEGKHGLQDKILAINDRMLSVYGNTLRKCFRYKKSILSFGLLSLVASSMLFLRLPVDLIPAEDRGFFFAHITLPSGMGPDQVKEQQTRLEEIFKSDPDVGDFIDLNFFGNLFFVVSLGPKEGRKPQGEIIANLQGQLDEIPGILAFIQPYKLIDLEIDFGQPGQYKMVLQGTEFKDIEEANGLVKMALEAYPEFSFVQSSLKNDTPSLSMKINEDLADRFGFQKREVQELLQHAYGQASVGSIQKGAIKENIYMDLQRPFQSSSDAPSKLYLAAADGTRVPLSSVVQWEEKLGSPSLDMKDQLPSATIRFSLADGIAPNKGIKLAETIAKQASPENVVVSLDGAAKTVSTTLNQTLLLLLAASIVMYIVLGILYESFVHPFTILSSIPLAGLGGVLTLFLFDQPISIFSAVGFLLLIGIVKKNGIMMVDYAIEAQENGMKAEEAIFEACMARFRPIMMTTVVAIMGAIPIAIGFGDSGEMRQGLGLVIVGGLLFSQVLTLYVTPILYLVFSRFQSKKI